MNPCYVSNIPEGTFGLMDIFVGEKIVFACIEK
jgi:hypothetical protein